MWGKSLDELISGVAAKYKQLIGIAWLNVHRLYDQRGWQYLRLRLFLFRRGITMPRRVYLNLRGRRNRKVAQDSGS